MIFILFSAFGEFFSASDFVARHGINVDSVWSKGQSLRSGRLHNDSGFSVSFDAKTTKDFAPLIEGFLKNNKYWLSALREQPVERLIHLGVTVGEENSFAPSLEFDLLFLRMLVDEQIQLHLSAYPTSDA